MILYYILLPLIIFYNIVQFSLNNPRELKVNIVDKSLSEIQILRTLFLSDHKYSLNRGNNPSSCLLESTLPPFAKWGTLSVGYIAARTLCPTKSVTFSPLQRRTRSCVGACTRVHA